MSYVKFHMSHVKCHMSHVTCHMSHVTCQIFEKSSLPNRQSQGPKFWDDVHHPIFVTRHLSHVMCHISHVTGHMSHVTCQIFKILSLPNRQSQGPEILRQCSPPPKIHASHVTCQMSHVKCHMSNVTCHMSHVTCQIFKKLSLLNQQSQGPEILRQCSPPPICHVTHVICHVSHITCYQHTDNIYCLIPHCAYCILLKSTLIKAT